MCADLDKLDLTSLIYVADSVLITKETLKRMHDKKLSFISRLPATFELEKNLIDLAWKKNDWTFIGKISNQKNAAEY
ncbi:transposase, partial [Thermoanaerobacteraceae bacterium SP2]